MTPPWRTALFEGAGATLWWDLGTGASGVDVWDAPRAAGWLDAPRDAVRDTMRQAALVAWREAWWPASRVAGVAPLDPRVLAARKALALAALDGITDDDEAVERALRELGDHVARLGPLEDADLAERVRELADDYGAAGSPAPVPVPAPGPPRENYALAAAGGRAGGAPLLAGGGPVDPGAVPQGLVDPLGRIAWEVRLPLTVVVTVPAAPTVGAPPAVPLLAAAGGLEVPLRRAGATWFGEAPASPTVLTARPVVRLEVPGFPPVPGVDARRLVEIAREVGP